MVHHEFLGYMSRLSILALFSTITSVEQKVFISSLFYLFVISFLLEIDYRLKYEFTLKKSEFLDSCIAKTKLKR